MTESQAIILLSRWAGDHFCFPNVHLCGCEMDLAIVTRQAHVLWEVEVKLSLADWRADEHKPKWKRLDRRALVSRFYYAVSPDLVDKCPSFVRPETGILVVEDSSLHVHTHRPARPKRTPALTDRQFQHLLESTYWRFWRERLHRHRDARQRRKAAA